MKPAISSIAASTHWRIAGDTPFAIGAAQPAHAAAGAASPAIIPDPTFTGAQQQSLSDLSSKSGAAFDTAYAKAQVDAHQVTLDGLKAYSANGDVPQLKSFATTMIPIVTAHLNMAKGL